MCNLYSMTKGPVAIRELAGAMRESVGNLAPLEAIYPDTVAPIVRTGADGVRELVTARWGMPTPPVFLEGKRTDRGVTNIRNTGSAHWRRWTGPAHRCVVPFTAFSEPRRKPEGGFETVWFARDESRPLAFFAGLWTPWTGVRKLAEGPVTVDLFGFLTTEPNAEVAAIHPKAMPVILPDEVAIETWLTAPWAEAVKLQRPPADGALVRVG